MSTRCAVDAVGATPGSELERLVSKRIPDLAGYQNLAYARRYADFVAQVRSAEAAAALGSELSEAVARYLYKLMVYKDEYEVARLSVDRRLTASIKAEFGANATVSYLLHPPILRALGMRRKIQLDAWWRPVLLCLRSLRVLRGTVFDPFGHTRIRRMERALVAEYRVLIESAIRMLDAESYDQYVELASLPDMIRGYEHIKIANVERYHRRVDDIAATLGDQRRQDRV